MLRIILTMLLVTISLFSLTGCKTTLVYYVPIIEEPTIDEIPTREDFQDSGFKAVDDSNFLISEKDLHIYAKYIIDLKTYGNAGWTWVDYYITELERFNKEIPE